MKAVALAVVGREAGPSFSPSLRSVVHVFLFHAVRGSDWPSPWSLAKTEPRGWHNLPGVLEGNSSCLGDRQSDKRLKIWDCADFHAYCYSIYYCSYQDSYRDCLHVKVSSQCYGDGEDAEAEEICILDHCKTVIAWQKFNGWLRTKVGDSLNVSVSGGK